MISDFSPFYPHRPYPVFPVPSRVVELTLRKQKANVAFYGSHLVLVLSGVVTLSPSAASGAGPEGTFSGGHACFSPHSCSYSVSAGNAAVSSLCIYGFEEHRLAPRLPTSDYYSAARSSLFSHIPPVSRVPASSLSYLTESINDALKKDPFCGDLTAAGLLYPFMLSMAAKAPFAGHPSDTKNIRGETRFGPSSPLRHAVDFILKNYASPIGITDIEQGAMALGSSRTHLSRLFEETFGLRPVEYLQQYRLHRAALLLKHTDTSLEYIARECGFSGRSYLSTVFAKHYGESPTSYRKRHAYASPPETP